MHTGGEAGLGKAVRVASRGGDREASRRHDVGDRQKAAIGEQVLQNFGALVFAHGSLPFPLWLHLVDPPIAWPMIDVKRIRSYSIGLDQLLSCMAD